MTIPSFDQTQAYLREGERLNPGPWVSHSLNVAEAARAIADHHPALDPDRAYILGCLHDIGRRFGVTEMRHVLDGYRFLQAEGYTAAARICLTHSFVIPDTDSVAGRWDCSAEDLAFVQRTISALELDDYDRLIQLCDAIALPSGCCLIEKRLVDVVMRYGFNDFTLRRWQCYFDIQRSFEATIGQSIYAVLPGVVELTFEFTGPA